MTNQEINEAVAKKLGWDNKPFHGYIRPNMPNYSTDISAAWEVVEKHQISLKYYGEAWDCTLTKLLDGRWINAESTADTAPMAICLAFLKLETNEVTK